MGKVEKYLKVVNYRNVNLMYMFSPILFYGDFW